MAKPSSPSSEQSPLQKLAVAVRQAPSRIQDARDRVNELHAKWARLDRQAARATPGTKRRKQTTANRAHDAYLRAIARREKEIERQRLLEERYERARQRRKLPPKKSAARKRVIKKQRAARRHAAAERARVRQVTALIDGRTHALLRVYARSHNVNQADAYLSRDFQNLLSDLDSVKGHSRAARKRRVDILRAFGYDIPDTDDFIGY